MNENLNMSVSPIVEKDGTKHIYITFEDETRSAEGSLPEKKIIRNQGFSEEEVAALEYYIAANESDIVSMAKNINILDAFMNKK